VGTGANSPRLFLSQEVTFEFRPGRRGLSFG
jgi:hypothetical protein